MTPERFASMIEAPWRVSIGARRGPIPMPPTAVHSSSAATASELSTSDRSLVLLAARGDQHAFELLFRRHRSGVHAYALRMLADHAAAEDVVQEVFVSAMRSLRKGTKPVHVRAWLQEIARCACVDHWRGSERRREVSYDAPDSLSGKDARQMAVSGDVAMRGAVDRESLADLQSAFEDLPPLQHSVLVQRELEGRSSNEIAERLGISPTVVEGQLARGRRSLAVAYRELQSGERCTTTQNLCEASLDRALGVRDRARVRVHLRTCSSCRRHARAAGVEPRLFDPRVLSHLGFLLPLPLLRRFPLNSLFASSESLGAAIAGKALVGAAVIAAGSGSALVMSDLKPDRGADPAPVVREQSGQPTAVAASVPPVPPSGSSSPAVLVPASSAADPVGDAPQLRAAAFEASPAAPATSDAREPRESSDVPRRPDAGGTVLPGVGRPGASDVVHPVPLTLPRFVPSAPPRVQRLAPVVEVPEQGGGEANEPGEGASGGPSYVIPGKPLPGAPGSKIGTDPQIPDSKEEPKPAPEPEPQPQPEPEPGTGDGTDPPVDPDTGDSGSTPTEPEAPTEPEVPPVDASESEPTDAVGSSESIAPEEPDAPDAASAESPAGGES